LLIALGLVVLLVVLGATACSSAEEPADEAAEQTEETASDEATGAASADDAEHWMNGMWGVEFTLVTVDPDQDWARAAADQPYAEWESMVEDGQMTIVAETTTEQTVTYEAPLTENADGTLTFDARDQWTDDDGVVWTSHIVADITQIDDGSFTAEQWGEISSDSDGVLYTATWTAVGSKIE
jgi:hypothetical protein